MDWKRLTSPAFVVSLLLLGGAGASLNAAVSALKLYLRKLPIEMDLKLSSVPTQTENWECVGAEAPASEEFIAELGTSNYISRLYRRKGAGGGAGGAKGRGLELHVAYYTGMIDTVPHVPERCLVGGGWSITGSSRLIPLKMDQDRWIRETDASGGVSFKARVDTSKGAGDWPGARPVIVRPYVHLPRGIDQVALRTTEFTGPGNNAKLYAGYFFVANGGIATRPEEVRLLAFDLRDDYAYYLKVQFSGEGYASADEMATDAGSLLEEVLPDLMQCVPDWKEVEQGEYPPDNPRRGKQH